MKKNAYILLGLVAAIMGCAKEAIESVDVPQEEVYSEFVVICGSCPVSTKTDISEGKTSWEKGDTISVVYDGTAYIYTAYEAGSTTYFTSTDGIASYDSTKTMMAYYPAVTADGVVSIDETRTVTFASDSQSNSAEAPLVGFPSSNTSTENVVAMGFKNIFSIIELRVDAGEISSKAVSMTVEPVDSSEFQGYITVSGTVDYETLEVTPLSQGTCLTLEFTDGADLSSALTVKFPVGRFSTTEGLKLTVTTEDGSKYYRNIYKSGLTSYTLTDGVYTPMHFAKELYAFAASGGISSAEDLVNFATAVNTGTSISTWMNAEGKVCLLNDIDMSEVTSWTPIGDGTCSWSSNVITITGNPFTGYFDGQGYSIKNFNLTCTNETTLGTVGLFGVIGTGAVVENIVIDATSCLNVTSAVGCESGILSGVLLEGTVRNIVNYAPLTFTNTSATVRQTMGIIGFAYARDYEAVMEKVVNYGAVTGEAGSNTNNGATAVQIAGICGFSSNEGTSTEYVRINDCINYGDITSSCARAAGIVGAANRYTYMCGCVNYGDNANSFSKSDNARIGNITCITGSGSIMEDCINYGDVICSTSGGCGGLICLVNHKSNEFIRCKSYGRVISDRSSYVGTFFGQCTLAAAFEDCVAGGAYGTYNSGEYSMVEITSDNYMDYIGTYNSSATGVTSSNIAYASYSSE